MFKRIISCPRPNFSARTSLRLSLLLLLPHCANAQPSLPRAEASLSASVHERAQGVSLSLRLELPRASVLALRAHARRMRALPATVPFTQTRMLAQTTPPQQSTGTQSTLEVTTLEGGKPVEREIAGGQKHSYQIALAEGQFFRIVIKRQGTAIRASLQQPDGKTIQAHDMFFSHRRELEFEQVAESSGNYQLDVHARAKDSTGRYEVLVVELRPAAENDRELQQARNLFKEITQLQRGGKFFDARPLVMRALEIRERVLGAGTP